MRPGEVLAGRWELLRELGAGAMGIVYQAYDRERREAVAVKTLRGVDPTFLFRLKQEFRELAGLIHPNLVRLHELASVGEDWWIAMELVAGVAFTDHVREQDASGTPSCDPARLRPALAQLVDAIATVHAAGKLHRDIKPGNVLVTPAGRVVLLDFGLVTGLSPDALRHESIAGLFGTPAYMPPELFDGGAPSPASDWYALGALLFEAFAGVPPFEGSFAQVVLAKQRDTPLRPSARGFAVPRELDDLCARLLARSPEARPSLGELRVAFPQAPAPALGAASWRMRSGGYPTGHLVGREPELERLSRSWAAVHDHARSGVILIRGASGIGKTALVREFLRELGEREPGLLVLGGRCHARESVPFKAVDPIVDELVRHLRCQSPAALVGLLPADLGALARAFPVLRRLEGAALASDRPVDGNDPQELRRRAVSALRELLARLALRQPTVVWVDDLQWCDADSAVLWAELLRPPEAPPVLWIGCHRRAPEGGAPGLATFLERVASLGGGEVLVLDLDGLGPSAATSLARECSGHRLPEHEWSRIAAQSDGHPYFLMALADWLAERDGRAPADGGAAPEPATPSLAALLARRIERLPAAARRLLEVVAVAGGPVEEAVARAVAGLPDPGAAIVESLEDGRWIDTWRDGALVIDTYHDRIREAALALASDGVRAGHHGRLADRWIATGGAEPGRIADHLRAAGRRREAARFLDRAARHAADVLAFESAARLFRAELESIPDDERAQVELELARALANAGHGAAAAEMFLAAALRPDAVDPLGWRWQAAEQWLRAGYVDRGLEHAAEVLKALGMPMPVSPGAALRRLVLERATLGLSRLLGGSPRRREADELELRRIDACSSFAAAMGLVDPIVGAYYQAKHFRLARRLTGDPHRLSRALALEAAYRAALGGAGADQIGASFEEAHAEAQASGEARATGFVQLLEGIAWHQQGDWARSRALAAVAEATFRDRCAGVAWERVNARRLLLTNLYWQGDFAELARLVPAILADAARRGDHYEALVVQGFFSVVVHLAAGDVEGAAREVAAASSIGGSRTSRLFDVYRLLGACHVDLHVGRPELAWARLQEGWGALEASKVLMVSAAQILTTDLRARVALLAAHGPVERRRCVSVAARDARVLGRHPIRWPHALAWLVEAGLAIEAGQRDRASALLARAKAGFEARGMRVHAAAAELRLAELGPAVRASPRTPEATVALRRAGLADPARWVAIVAPVPGTGLPVS